MLLVSRLDAGRAIVEDLPRGGPPDLRWLKSGAGGAAEIGKRVELGKRNPEFFKKAAGFALVGVQGPVDFGSRCDHQGGWTSSPPGPCKAQGQSSSGSHGSAHGPGRLEATPPYGRVVISANTQARRRQSRRTAGGGGWAWIGTRDGTGRRGRTGDWAVRRFPPGLPWRRPRR